MQTASSAQLLASLPERVRARHLEQLSEKERAFLATHWPFWARPDQMLPAGNWSTWLIMAGRGYGKLSWVEEPILTARGWSTMGELVDGDQVYDQAGKLTRVVKAHAVVTPLKCYRVTFSDGESVLAGGEHLWTVVTHRWCKQLRRQGLTIGDLGGDWWSHEVPLEGRPITLTTERMVGREDLSIPVCQPLEGEGLGAYEEARRALGDADHRKIVSIERVDRVPMRCITVDSPSRLYLIGRGLIPTHNTRTGAEAIRSLVCGPTPLAGGAYRRVAIIGETAADCRDVIVEGESGLLGIHPPDFRPSYVASKRRLTWPNGAQATLYNATEPDQLRGPQHDLLWGEELAKWAYAREAWDQAQFGLRLGAMPRAIITTTPRPIPVLKEILADPSTHVTRGSTLDNSSNLAKRFIEGIYKRYGGTRLGRQELEAEILDDLPGALWTRAYFDPPDGSPSRGRVLANEVPDLRRVVVAVDPSGIKKESDGGDSIGIVVAGVDYYEHGYVLADLSMRGGPAEWARVAVWAFHHFKADRLVAESNYGGAMVESVIRSVDRSVPYSEVKATRGKVVRAEPVAALYEQGRVSHVSGANPRDEGGTGLSAVEDQLCLFASHGYTGGGSPDRADALVWALTDLMIREQGYDFDINL